MRLTEQKDSLRVQMFGNFQAWQGNRPIVSSRGAPNKSIAILKLLLLERGRAYTKDELIDQLYVDSDYDKASGNLRVRISELRQALEPDLVKKKNSRYILTVHEGYRFNPDIDCSIDVERFSKHTTIGYRRWISGELLRAKRHFSLATSLYKGLFLPEDRYEEWAIPYQNLWKDDYISTLLKLSECELKLDQNEQAIQHSHKAICAAPLREDALRQLMRCHWKNGSRAAALRVYEKACTRLSTTSAIEPSKETQWLYRDILKDQANVQLVKNGAFVQPLPEQIDIIGNWQRP